MFANASNNTPSYIHGQSKGGCKGLAPLTSVVENYAKMATFIIIIIITIITSIIIICNCIIKIYGAFSTLLERCFQDLSNGILQASKFLLFLVGKTKNIRQLFSNCRASSSKKLQWENDNGFFFAIFSTNALKESQ
jgi:hypothetical protein